MSKGTATRKRSEAKRDQSLRAMGVRAWITQRTTEHERRRQERRREQQEKVVRPSFRPGMQMTGPVDGSRDRTLAGKKRIRARRAAKLAARS